MSYVSRYEKKLMNKLDDEIKLTILKALAPEELEKHLILNSNRLRTFEHARLEIVTYVDVKFGLRIRDSKPSDTGAGGRIRGAKVETQCLEDILTLWMLMRLIPFRLAEAKGHRVHEMVVSSAVLFTINVIAMQRQQQAIVWQRKAEQQVMVQQ